jgi:tRNA pseudouridine38-40 synthase
MRYFKATVEYDGTDFAGFQWQHDIRTVQGTLEAALAQRTGQTVRLTGAGRTDAGVHALGQVVSFGCETRIPIERMAIALNTALPPDLTVRQVEEVGPGFSARFSASSRLYAYLILNRDMRSPVLRRYSALCVTPLDVRAMQESARLLLGEQDFACFTNELIAEQMTMRDVMRCQVGRYRKFVVVRIEANAFLRGMVRNIVGTLMEVGMGKRPVQDIPRLLESRDRRQAGPTAPPQGLCLLKARYGQRKNYGMARSNGLEAEI